MIPTYPDLGLNVMQHTPLHHTVYCAPLCDAIHTPAPHSILCTAV